MSAPMDTVSGEVMIRKLAKMGAIGVIPRNNNFSNTVSMCDRLSKDSIPCVYALGLSNAFEEARQLEQRGAKIILIDVAHGGMEKVLAAVKEIKSKSKIFIIAGNIVSYQQALAYKKCGVDWARVGVGPGGACITRVVTGIGFPQLSAIFETTKAGIPVIADGGIRKSGDVAKALAAGAKMVMIGSMFAGTEESPGEVVEGMKEFRGQASEGYMKDLGIEVDGFRAAEGVSTHVRTKGSVEHIINDITGGIRSAMSYIGAKNLKELDKMAVFNVISSATASENQPHILYTK